MSNNKKYNKQENLATPAESETEVEQVMVEDSATPEEEVEVEQVMVEDSATPEEEVEIAGVEASEFVASLTNAALDYVTILCAQYIGVSAYASISESVIEAIESGRQVVVGGAPPAVVITPSPFASGDRNLDVAGSHVFVNVNRKLADARMLD
jgi:hypothetical protein